MAEHALACATTKSFNLQHKKIKKEREGGREGERKILPEAETGRSRF